MKGRARRLKGHVGTYREEPGLIDLWVCTCGWTSSPYYDGAEWAEDDFLRHIAAVKLGRAAAIRALSTATEEKS